MIGLLIAEHKFRLCSFFTSSGHEAGRKLLANKLGCTLVSYRELVVCNTFCIPIEAVRNTQHFYDFSVMAFVFSLLFSFVHSSVFLVFVFSTCMSPFVRTFLWYIRRKACVWAAQTIPALSPIDFFGTADSLEPCSMWLFCHARGCNLEMTVSGSGRPVLVHNTVADHFYKVGEISFRAVLFFLFVS